MITAHAGILNFCLENGASKTVKHVTHVVLGTHWHALSVEHMAWTVKVVHHFSAWRTAIDTTRVCVCVQAIVCDQHNIQEIYLQLCINM